LLKELESMGVLFHGLSGRSRVIAGVVLLAAMLAAWPGVPSPAALAREIHQESPGASASETPSALEWEQWFYGQRTYGLGYIPEEALTRAVEQRDRSISTAGTGASSAGFRRLSSEASQSLPHAAAGGDPWVPLGPGGISSLQDDMVSGRLTSIAVNPRNPATVYVAAAGGGVWKTTDGGATWSPLTDSLPSLASGAVAVDPFTGAVWYGTGELNFCRDCYYGAGVYRSGDGGATWERVAPENFLSSPTSFIRFDPRHQGTLFIGRSTALWKSSDGGASWRVVLRGAVTDFAFNSADSSIAYAAVGYYSGSPENGVYRSADAGETWQPVSQGLPEQTSMGRIALGTVPADASILYALIVRSSDFELNGLYRSLDGGATWSLLPNLPADIFSEDGQGQGAFSLFVRGTPGDAAVVYVGAIGLWRSADFGDTWTNLSESARLHEDQHDIAFDPADPRTFYLIGDSGVWRTSNGGETFRSLNSSLAVTQFQTVGLHPSNPALAVGGTQDNGTILYRGGFAWQQGRPGDSGAAFYSSDTPERIYAVARRHSVRRSDDGGQTFRLISEGLDEADLVQFYPPFLSDPNQPDTLYLGTYRVWRSQDGGEHWQPLSGNLTGDDSATLSALAVAPSSSLVLYAGSSNGRVKVSHNGGIDWSPAAELPARFVTSIAVHPASSSSAFVSLSGFGTGHVFRTDDAGASWQNISGDLPDIPVNTVLLDAVSPDTIYLGTDIGVFVLAPDGSWTPLQKGLPNAVVLGLSQNPATGLLVAATHGRGAFALFLGEPAERAARISAIVNAAGFGNSPLAPGMSAALFGANLAPETVVAPEGDSLPFSLAGTSITVNGVPAPLFFAAPGQVNFLVPFGISGPLAEVVLRSDHGEAAVKLPQAPASPASFLVGTDPSVYRGNGARVWDFSRPQPGEELVLFANGLGAVEPDVPSGWPAPSSPLAHTVVLPTIRIGGREAVVRFAGLTPGFVGLYQVNFVVPAETPAGRAEFVVESGGVSSPVLTLPIAPFSR
jgi:uncharacterized protein (TIGR03437 family)